MRARLALVLVVSLMVAAAGAAAGADCLVKLEVSPSRLAFAGESAASVMPGAGFPVAVAGGKDDAPVAISLAGAMWLRVGGAAACPTSQAGWRDALAQAHAAGGLTLTSGASGYHYAPLALSPPTLPLAVMGVPLNMSAMQFNVTMRSSASSGGAAAPRAGPGGSVPLALDVNATVAQGYVYSNTPLTGGPQLQPMGQSNSLSTASGSINVTGAAAGSGKAGSGPSLLTLSLQDLNLTFVGKTYGVAGGKPWSGSLTFSLAGVRACNCRLSWWRRTRPLNTAAAATAAAG